MTMALDIEKRLVKANEESDQEVSFIDGSQRINTRLASKCSAPTATWPSIMAGVLMWL